MNLIIGCGYLGRRVADLWLRQGKSVASLTRGRAAELKDGGIEPLLGDVLDPASLVKLPAADTVLYAVGLDRSAGRSFREVYLDGLRNVLAALPRPKRFVYVSSTSVYGQMSGEIVDETSPTEPREENGQIVLEAERLLRAQLPDAVVLRFAGIYGPDRLLRRAAIEKGEALGGDPEQWLNLIHVDDGAQAVLASEEHARSGEAYLIADNCPVQRREFFAYLAELLGAPAPRFTAISGESNRRMNNRKMNEDLRIELRHPDYRSGLRASL